MARWLRRVPVILRGGTSNLGLSWPVLADRKAARLIVYNWDGGDRAIRMPLTIRQRHQIRNLADFDTLASLGF
jgi:hypothetical protein